MEFPLRVLHCATCLQSSFELARITNPNTGETYDAIRCLTCEDDWVPLSIAQAEATQRGNTLN